MADDQGKAEETSRATNHGEVKRRLLEADLPTDSHRVLMLLPLVYVAWADGKMEHVEVERIFEFAREHLHFPPAAERQLKRWLLEPPSKDYVQRGIGSLLDIALDEQELAVDVSELQGLVLHAEAIARATAGDLDLPSSITAEEHAAIEEIARMLEVDNGKTWADVLEEVKSQRAPARQGN